MGCAKYNEHSGHVRIFGFFNIHSTMRFNEKNIVLHSMAHVLLREFKINHVCHSRDTLAVHTNAYRVIQLVIKDVPTIVTFSAESQNEKISVFGRVLCANGAYNIIYPYGP